MTLSGGGDVANAPLDFPEVDRTARIAVEIVRRARAHQLVVSDRDATIRVQVKVVAIKHGVQTKVAEKLSWCSYNHLKALLVRETL